MGRAEVLSLGLPECIVCQEEAETKLQISLLKTRWPHEPHRHLPWGLQRQTFKMSVPYPALLPCVARFAHQWWCGSIFEISICTAGWLEASQLHPGPNAVSDRASGAMLLSYSSKNYSKMTWDEQILALFFTPYVDAAVEYIEVWIKKYVTLQ